MAVTGEGKVKITPVLNLYIVRLSDDLRIKTVEKHQQHQSYKSISRCLNLPLSTVCNRIRKFTNHRRADFLERL